MKLAIGLLLAAFVVGTVSMAVIAGDRDLPAGSRPGLRSGCVPELRLPEPGL